MLPFSMPRLALFLVLAAAALLAPAAAESHAAVPRGFFGVQVNGPLDQPSVDLDAEARTMRAAGVESWRVEFAWDQLERDRGSFDFAATDRKVLAAARAGMDVLGLIVRAPAWANGGNLDPFVPPRSAAALAGYATALVGRYGPGGSLWAEHPEVPARPVRAWEVWNEPNLKNYFNVKGSFVRPYARLLRAAAPAIKRADKGATVLMASMANYSWRDLARLLKAERRLPFDVAGAHPFSGRPSNALKIVRLNRAVLNRYGYRKRPMWLTELTWSSAKGKKTPLTKNWETTEKGQAERLRQAYRLLLRDRKRLRLARIYWYTWATVDRESKNSFDYSGLRTWTGGSSFVDKPALAAFRAVVRAAR
ncbi:MAG: beta-galactosidase [Solirubrobacterales bacterium]|nr:beta-galactosidase [Solirubrobacterales bacterium]